MSNGTYTYTGVWIDWSEGAICGATVTLSQKWAGILTASLAVVVSSAGSLFWNILAFTIHQAFTTKVWKKRDALHHQRQVILRNKGTLAAAWALLLLPFANQRKASKRFLRSLPFSTFAILTLLLFSLSGLFTSYISKLASASTLTLSSDCGGFEVDVVAGVISPLITKGLLDTYDAATYVRQCYQGDPNGPTCRTFPRPYLPFTTNSNTSCPFGDNMCAYNNQSAFQMDTGLLDSHKDFGINAPPEERLKFRRVCTCAPIHHGAALATVTNDSTFGEVIYVNAGSQPALGDNYTFVYTPAPNSDSFGYTLDDDPWMTAQINETMAETNTTLVMWSKSYEINLLGCIDQYQVCNPNKAGDSGCTTLGGIGSALHQAFTTKIGSLGFNIHQVMTASRLLSTVIDNGISSNVNGRGGAALNASMMAYQNIQTYIPPNQWQIEVSTWFATSLAKDQSQIVEWAAGPKNLPSGGWHITKPQNKYAQSQCNNQLVPRASGYENFSILGLAVTLMLCGIIVIIGLTIDTVVGWLRRGKSRYMRDQWEMEETLALQKAAYVGMDLWREDEEAIPLRAGEARDE
ncbi:uncharacterized protein N7482_009879 [Penicillium canariense]|uniref:Uncharacterized protein n=1 Tax=Penicillium canariense TaxID=189055 RepID=A0A9W9HPJ7_9EURO|nr:uncharacterized protein N7482_009879 [Penicillium canariense]KAJ5153401.1 hypothetical protein N7482_009879 [Penicillium canariense]